MPDRGSDKLKVGLDEAKLKALISKMKRLKLDPDIIINGQPRPDWVSGTFRAKNPEKLAEGIKTIFEVGPAAYNLNKILIRGIPIPDDLLVRFEIELR